MNWNKDKYTTNILQGHKQLIHDIIKLNPVYSDHFHTLFNGGISKYCQFIWKKNIPLTFKYKVFQKYSFSGLFFLIFEFYLDFLDHTHKGHLVKLSESDSYNAFAIIMPAIDPSKRRMCLMGHVCSLIIFFA